jgi:hypothetical protein
LRKVLRMNKGGFLPQEFDVAHDFCFVLHDLMANALVYGERAGLFVTRLPLKGEDDARALEEAEDIFKWLEEHRSAEERLAILTKSVFPAVFSDALHFIYEALETSRKGKLGVSYALLRKPLQENLFILEAIVLDSAKFADTLAINPLELRAQRQGGLEVHAQRIQRVLDILGMQDLFSAKYLAQLRYAKGDDGFDGICNKAVHLFTEHQAIRTENMNINFVFSGWEEKLSQWSYLYSRLPYVLAYAHGVAEHAIERFGKTATEYINMARRQTGALALLWFDEIEHSYRNDELEHFVANVREWLYSHCAAAGARAPSKRDLERMSHTGALPGESWVRVWLRNRRFARAARLAEKAKAA